MSSMVSEKHVMGHVVGLVIHLGARSRGFPRSHDNSASCKSREISHDHVIVANIVRHRCSLGFDLAGTSGGHDWRGWSGIG